MSYAKWETRENMFKRVIQINENSKIEKGGFPIMYDENNLYLTNEESHSLIIGTTGSGKTTLLRIIASTVPKNKRMILIQNPTEISFFEKDAYGRNTRNVVHWEVVQSADDSKNTSASMANLISNSLRATPEVVLIGEAREPEEFQQIQRAMRTGHKTLGTFHAEDAKDAIGRFASEISGGNSYIESVRMVADSIDIIISQFKFENGERKVMEISEVLGTDKDGEPITIIEHGIRKTYTYPKVTFSNSTSRSTLFPSRSIPYAVILKSTLPGFFI